MDDEASGRASPPARPTVTSPEEQPQLAQRAGCKAQGKNWKIRKYISPLTNYIFLQTFNGYQPKPVEFEDMEVVLLKSWLRQKDWTGSRKGSCLRQQTSWSHTATRRATIGLGRGRLEQDNLPSKPHHQRTLPKVGTGHNRAT